MQHVKIGTRGSALALVQAEAVAARLAANNGWEGAGPDSPIEIVSIQTTGDTQKFVPLGTVNVKGLFTKEIDDALLAGGIDLAVHSAKDLPADLPAGVIIAAYLERDSPYDAFVSRLYHSLDALADNHVVGTSSARRKAQVLAARPDIKVVNFRGNVDTRLKKIDNDTVDATLVAVAGLQRLGLTHHIKQVMEPDVMLPAVGQGALAVLARADDAGRREMAAAISHRETELVMTAERAFLAALGGSCRSPIAGLAELEDGGRLRLRGRLLAPDGSQRFDVERSGRSSNAEAIGQEVGDALRAEAGADFVSRLGMR